MELPLQTLTLSLVSAHPGLRSCLILPVIVVSLNLAHCFPGLQNLGLTLSAGDPFPPELILNKSFAHHTTLPFVIQGSQA